MQGVGQGLGSLGGDGDLRKAVEYILTSWGAGVSDSGHRKDLDEMKWKIWKNLQSSSSLNIFDDWLRCNTYLYIYTEIKVDTYGSHLIIFTKALCRKPSATLATPSLPRPSRTKLRGTKKEGKGRARGINVLIVHLFIVRNERLTSGWRITPDTFSNQLDCLKNLDF